MSEADAGTPPPKKPRAPLTEAQREGLARGRAVAAERRAEKKKNGETLVQTSSAAIREAQRVPPPPGPEDYDDDADEPPESESGTPPPPGKRFRSIEDVVSRHETTNGLPTVEQAAREAKLYTMGREALPPAEQSPHLQGGIMASGDGEVADLVGAQEPKNLDDLMSQCPMIGDGQYYIKVERRAPQHYGGISCKGIQRPITAYMNDRDFVRAYGGGDYTLILYGPPKRGGSVDPRTGRPRQKALSPPVKLELSPSIYPPNLQAGLLEDVEEEEDDMRYVSPGFGTSSGGGLPQRPATTADARLLDVQLTHEERRELRNEERERQFRESQQKLGEHLGPMLDVVHKSTQESLKLVERTSENRARLAEQQAERAEAERRSAEERAESEKRRSEERTERERNRPTEAAVMMKGLSDMVAALKTGDDGGAARHSAEALDQARQEIQRLTANHSAEIQRLVKTNTDDVSRLQDKHANELSRAQTDYRAELQRVMDTNRNEIERVDRQHRDEQKRLEDRLKENIDRAEKRAEDAERKAGDRVRETDERAEKRLGELREESRRVLEEQRAAHQQRIDDERRQHDRDLKTQGATFAVQLAGQKDMYENRGGTTAAEITRLQADVERYRKEAEDNRDIGKHIERLEESAAALGWGPQNAQPDGPEPPKDWKEMVSRIGMDLVQKLPEIVQSAGETVRSLRGQPQMTPEQVQQVQYEQMMQNSQNTVPRQMAGMGAMPPPLRGRGGVPFEAAPLRFGMEDGSGFQDPGAPLPRPQVDYGVGAPPPPAPAAPPAPPQAPMMVPQGMPNIMQSPPPPQMIPAQPQYQPPPQMMAPAPQVPAPQVPVAAPGAIPLVIPSEMILEFAPALESAFGMGAPVAQVVDELLPMIGAENLARILSGVKPERVVAELQRAGKSGSPLVRRAGQQFLRDLWAAAGARLGTG